MASSDFPGNKDTRKVPDGLPEVDYGTPKVSPVDKAKFCPDCGKEGRVASNHLGRRGYCYYCKIDWPISGPRTHDLVANYGPRGIGKQTLVEPDWDILSDPEDDDEFKKSS